MVDFGSTFNNKQDMLLGLKGPGVDVVYTGGATLRMPHFKNIFGPQQMIQTFLKWPSQCSATPTGWF